jgi:hypothetical protein
MLYRSIPPPAGDDREPCDLVLLAAEDMADDLFAGR